MGAASEQNVAMPERALSADAVVDAALELLDEVGLHRFTMRALAQRLGTHPATIYWHVGSRGEVLSRVSARVMDAAWADLPDPASAPWDEWIAEFARAYRRAMHSHPAMATWAVTHHEAKVRGSDDFERLLLALSGAGFRNARLSWAYSAFLGSLVGWVGVELIADDPELGTDPTQMEASVRTIRDGDRPVTAATVEHLANQAFGFRWEGGVTNPLDAAFDFALATWVDGLRQQLDA